MIVKLHGARLSIEITARKVRPKRQRQQPPPSSTLFVSIRVLPFRIQNEDPVLHCCAFDHSGPSIKSRSEEGKRETTPDKSSKNGKNESAGKERWLRVLRDQKTSKPPMRTFSEFTLFYSPLEDNLDSLTGHSGRSLYFEFLTLRKGLLAHLTFETYGFTFQKSISRHKRALHPTDARPA